MKWPIIGVLVVAFVFLAYGTVAVFFAIDRSSHSVSDTLRPFVITMFPVWGVAVWAAVTLLREPHR